MSTYFKPISVEEGSCQNDFIRRKRNPFNDLRLYTTWQLISDRFVKEQINSVSQIAYTSSELAKFYRFFGNKRVENKELIKMTCQINQEVIKGRAILCIGDSTSFNLSNNCGRIKDPENLGVLNDGKTPGFGTHASLAVDAANFSIIGLVDMIHWKRPKDISAPELKDPVSTKEVFRWYMGASNSSEMLKPADKITYLFDREADSFSLFEHILLGLKEDFVIRSQHDRKVIFNGKSLKMKEVLAKVEVADTYILHLPPLNHRSKTAGKRISRKKRDAKMEIRFATVEVQKPSHLEDGASSLTLSIIEAKEVLSEHLPEGEKPVCWQLWTTHPIENGEDARRIVLYYTKRWMIEQLFRTAKKEGFKQESTDMRTVDAILKQTTMVLKAASTVLQLVYARNREDAPPIETIFDQEEQEVLEKLNERLEGKTEKQQNLFPRDQLSWAAWIIARLGGWKGYQSQRPPGPITMKTGLDKFASIFEGYQLINT